MHVLVIDNDRDNSDLVYHALSHAGYEVFQAWMVADALRLSRLYPDIGIVVTDMRLDHEVTGLEMARKMRQNLHNSHYILTSGDWDALSRHCPNDISVLRKPYGKADLLRAVRHGAARRFGYADRAPPATKRQQETGLLLA
jgi:DNA-binding NtrC family response regulator